MSSTMANTSFDDHQRLQDIQDLLHQRFLIDAKLANFQTASVPSASIAHHGRHQSSQEVAPRSHSYNGQSMSRTISSGRSRRESVAMSSSRSQRPPTAMSRTGSKHASSTGSIPFTNTGRVPPPLQMADSQQNASAIDSWTTAQEDPMTAYSFNQRPLARSLSQRSALENVAEIDSGELPDEYFARTAAMPILSVTPSPIDMPNSDSWQISNHRGSFSQRRQSFNIQTPTTPSTTTLSTGTTASDLSRTSSFCNESIMGPFDMMNVHSNTSFEGISYQSRLPLNPSSPYTKLTNSSEEQSFLLAGACGASEESQFPLSSDDFRGETTQYPTLVSFTGSMKRTQSSESGSSSTSIKSRATTMLKRQNQLATRLLAPKADVEGHEISREGSHTLDSMKPKDGLENKTVEAISKVPYKRPKHERVYCRKCNEHPEGFRGQHELGRHQDREHNTNVKKLVCIEPVDGIIDPLFRPVNPLSKCKSCSQVKKKYGVYYNAAAHLRRAHFRPKARGRGKASKIEDQSDKQAAKAEREWPPMSELKRWMKEVYEEAEPNDENSSNSDNDDDELSTGFDVDEEYLKGQDILTENFDNTYLLDAAMLDVHSASPSNFNNLSMQNMQYDNLPLQPSIDLTTMHIDSSPSSFVESQFASMNDSMSFIDGFPQNFDDQSLGQDLFNNFQYQV